MVAGAAGAVAGVVEDAVEDGLEAANAVADATQDAVQAVGKVELPPIEGRAKQQPREQAYVVHDITSPERPAQ